MPSEWKLIDDNLVNIDSDSTLIEKIAELESYVLELEEVVSNIDLKDINDDEKLEHILNGLETGALTFEDMSDYDKALYDNHLNSNTSTSSNNAPLNELNSDIENKLLISADEALNNESTLKSIEEFDNNKDELESYALGNFGIELDKRKSFTNMYNQLASTLETGKC